VQGTSEVAQHELSLHAIFTSQFPLVRVLSCLIQGHIANTKKVM
jgi:hypothetical protein